MRREQSAKNTQHFFSPYKQFGMDLFKNDNYTLYNTRNKLINPSLKAPASLLRPLSKSKSDSLFEVGKKLKKLTLSNKSFFNYMNKYTKLTQNFTFKIPNVLIYPRKKNPKYLPIFYLQKIGYNKDDKKDNNKEKMNNDYSNNNNFNEYNNLDNVNYLNKYNENENDNTIKEKPYGFKFKDTRIVYDKSKIRVKSSLFKSNSSNFNITNINPSQNFKNRTNYNFHISKEEKKRNKLFKYFYEGDFLQDQTQRPQSHFQIFEKKKKNNNNNIIIKDYNINNNIQILYEMIKDINNKNNIENLSWNKTMKYNIKNYYKREDFSYQIDINSVCLKFINQDTNTNKSKKNNYSKNDTNNSQKLYIPFEYLPLFYLLDFTSFKIFLSEIIYYNKQTKLMEINKNELLLALNKYKKFINLNVINQDSNKKRKMEKITYECKEQHYQNIYDWIIYLNNEENNNQENEENQVFGESSVDIDENLYKD